MIAGLLLAASIDAAPEAVIQLRPYLKYQTTIDAKIEGVPGTYLFDTGEGVTAISSDIAATTQCHPWGRITGFRMTGERGGNPHCDNLVFRAGNVDLTVPSAIILDVMKLIGPDVPRLDGAIGLDAFAGRTITIVPRSCIIVESAASLEQRIQNAKPLRVRIVRDAEGIALAVDAAVPTSEGMAWMELDSGNGGSFVVANYIADLLGLKQDISTAVPASFTLEDGIVVSGPTRTRDLIMDGDIGARFLNGWNLTLDLANGRAWLANHVENGCPASST